AVLAPVDEDLMIAEMMAMRVLCRRLLDRGRLRAIGLGVLGVICPMFVGSTSALAGRPISA
ncbi:MAG TPA: hypothetical protein VIP98_17340, partial [Microlunatus sp.]